MSSSKLIRGTFILTIGMVFSKILGLFYIIPYNEIVGPKGLELYGYAYTPYTIFISIATAGVPLAVSKFVAKYNAMGEYQVSRELFRSGQKVMAITGLLAFIIMYALAPHLVSLTDESNFTVAEVAVVIRSVSFALLLVPIMSLFRGFFQGNESMGPTAISQVLEQVVRIIVLLVGAFFALQVMNKDIVFASGIAMSSAFFGAVASFAVLLVYWKKRKKNLDKMLEQDKGEIKLSLYEIYKEIIIYAIPFVFVGIAMPLYQQIDQVTFSKALAEVGLGKQSGYAFSVLNVSAQKLVMIPMTLATAFSLAIVPNVTRAYIEQNWLIFKRQLNQTFQILMFVLLPAVLGMSVLAKPVYTVFFGQSGLGTEVLAVYAPVALLFASFSISAAILQGINQQKYTVLSLLVGILIKLSLNVPFIHLFETRGAVYATALGYLASSVINLYVIYYFTGYKFNVVARRSLLILILSGLMAVLVYFLKEMIGLNSTNRGSSLLLVAICAPFGGILYFYVTLKTGLLHIVFGERTNSMLRRFRLHRFIKDKE